MLKPYLWHALRRLRKPSRLTRLAQMEDAGEFIDQMFLAAGRNLTVAAGFLPEEMRNEGKIAFLCCRALDAHEDLNHDADIAAQRIAATADYLQGKGVSPPPPPANQGSRESDQLEFLVASRLPWLRQAISSLPPLRRERVAALIDDLARAMIAHALPRFEAAAPCCYGEQVLGRVVRYALDLMQVEVPATVDPAPIGRFCQAINDLRDLLDDTSAPQEGTPCDVEVEKSLLWLELAEVATAVTSVMRDLRFPKTAGARGAMVYLTATTLKSIARQAKYPLPWLTLHPLGAALLADNLGSAYQRVLLHLDRTILGILVHGAQARGDAEPAALAAVPKMNGLHQDAFESALADQHPDPRSAILLKQGCRLLRYSILLTSKLPHAALSSRPSINSDGQLLMISDYLMAASFTVMQNAGLPILGSFSRTYATLFEELQQRPEPTDSQGHVAAFLTEVVGSAQGKPRAQRESLSARNRDISRALHCRDQRSSLLHQWYFHLFG